MTNLKGPIGNRTLFLPACSAVSQQTTLLRTPHLRQIVKRKDVSLLTLSTSMKSVALCRHLRSTAVQKALNT